MAACGFKAMEAKEEEQERKRMFDFKPVGKRDVNDITLASVNTRGTMTLETIPDMRADSDKMMANINNMPIIADLMKQSVIDEVTLTVKQLKKIGVEHDADVKMYVIKPRSL